MSVPPGKKKTARRSTPKLTLEKVIGNSVCGNASTATHPITGDILYTAGCVVIRYCARTHKQTAFYTTKASKPLACVAFSATGDHVVAGEAGKSPSCIVWDANTKEVLAELTRHQYGVKSVAFTLDGKHVVSLGFLHDSTLCVWDWKNQVCLSANKINCKVHAMSVALTGAYVVTSGHRHLKFWAIPADLTEKAAQSGVQTLEGTKASQLGPRINSNFIDAVCGHDVAQPDQVYAISSDGFLCLFGASRTLEKWVDVQVASAAGVAVTAKRVAVACADGTVRLFEGTSLAYKATLPRPPTLAQVDCVDIYSSTTVSDGVCPDAIGVRLSPDGSKVTVFYSDRAMFVWEASDVAKIGRYRSSLAHAATVWDLQLVPESADAPPNSFFTASTDNTIRMWTLAKQSSVANADAPGESKALAASGAASWPRNVFSSDLLRVVFVSEPHGVNVGPVHLDGDARPAIVNDRGARCLAVSPDGQFVAAGDRHGNIKVHSLPALNLVSEQEAHDAEVLSLSYSDSPRPLLASGSRDRLCHVFDARLDHHLVGTLDDHSASVTAVRFTSGGNHLLTASADKSVVFRTMAATGDDANSPRTAVAATRRQVVQYGTIFDMTVDRAGRFALTSGQDKRLNIWEVATSKVKRSYTGGHEATLRVDLDPAGVFVACGGADRTVKVLDFFSGDCLVKATGHSEPITAVRFTHGGDRLMSASADGTIMLWKLSSGLVASIHTRLRELGLPVPTIARPTPSPSVASSVAGSVAGSVASTPSKALGPSKEALARVKERAKVHAAANAKEMAEQRSMLSEAGVGNTAGSGSEVTVEELDVSGVGAALVTVAGTTAEENGKQAGVAERVDASADALCEMLDTISANGGIKENGTGPTLGADGLVLRDTIMPAWAKGGKDGDKPAAHAVAGVAPGSKWAQRLSDDGYNLYTEGGTTSGSSPPKIVPGAAVGAGLNLRFTAESTNTARQSSEMPSVEAMAPASKVQAVHPSSMFESDGRRRGEVWNSLDKGVAAKTGAVGVSKVSDDLVVDNFEFNASGSNIGALEEASVVDDDDAIDDDLDIGGDADEEVPQQTIFYAGKPTVQDDALRRSFVVGAGAADIGSVTGPEAPTETGVGLVAGSPPHIGDSSAFVQAAFGSLDSPHNPARGGGGTAIDGASDGQLRRSLSSAFFKSARAEMLAAATSANATAATEAGPSGGTTAAVVGAAPPVISNTPSKSVPVSRSGDVSTMSVTQSRLSAFRDDHDLSLAEEREALKLREFAGEEKKAKLAREVEAMREKVSQMGQLRTARLAVEAARSPARNPSSGSVVGSPSTQILSSPGQAPLQGSPAASARSLASPRGALFLEGGSSATTNTSKQSAERPVVAPIVATSSTTSPRRVDTQATSIPNVGLVGLPVGRAGFPVMPPQPSSEMCVASSPAPSPHNIAGKTEAASLSTSVRSLQPLPAVLAKSGGGVTGTGVASGSPKGSLNSVSNTSPTKQTADVKPLPKPQTQPIPKPMPSPVAPMPSPVAPTTTATSEVSRVEVVADRIKVSGEDEKRLAESVVVLSDVFDVALKAFDTTAPLPGQPAPPAYAAAMDLFVRLRDQLALLPLPPIQPPVAVAASAVGEGGVASGSLATVGGASSVRSSVNTINHLEEGSGRSVGVHSQMEDSMMSSADVSAALERYSDILVDMVQKKLATGSGHGSMPYN